MTDKFFGDAQKVEVLYLQEFSLSTEAIVR